MPMIYSRWRSMAPLAWLSAHSCFFLFPNSCSFVKFVSRYSLGVRFWSQLFFSESVSIRVIRG
jgi:hypothetical protein